MELAARDLKRVSLELGGKSPNIVFADSDWERAAASSPMSVFANAGEAPARSRVYVEQSVFEGFVDRFVEATRKLVVGDPAKDETRRTRGYSGQRAAVGKMADTQGQGEPGVGGGEPAGGEGLVYIWSRPCCWGVGAGDRCWREEIFGPGGGHRAIRRRGGDAAGRERVAVRVERFV